MLIGPLKFFEKAKQKVYICFVQDIILLPKLREHNIMRIEVMARSWLKGEKFLV